jgi:long-subunit fatty acid transport protein
MRIIVHSLLLVAATVIAGVGEARAQPADAGTVQRSSQSLQFNFSNPGARSLALAGALTAAGDDATGAWTNPAGLTGITRPEVSLELRSFDFNTRFVSGGRFNGAPTGLGIDTLPGLTFDRTGDSTRSLSFVSAVVPRSRVAFAFYRTQVLNFRSTTTSDGVFYREAGFDFTFRLLPSASTLDVKVANLGGAVSFRMTDQVSVGVGVSRYDLSLRSEIRSYDLRFSGLIDSPGSFFGTPIRTSANELFTDSAEGDDSAIGVNVGGTFSPNARLRLGGSFRQGAKFDITGRSFFFGETSNVPGVFRVPDIASAGVFFKPIEPLNVTVDYRRVKYSQLTNDQPDTLGIRKEDYVVDDANEVRVAGEYLLTNMPAPLSALAFRVGAWYDPDHQIRYVGAVSPDSVNYQRGEDEVHVTGGAGVVFRKVQFDVGFDRAESVTTVAVSAVVRF